MTEQSEYPVKTRIVTVTNKRTGVRYLVERKTQYDPQRRYNRVLSSRSLGQKIPQGAVDPVRCRPKAKPGELKSAPLIDAKRRRTGAAEIVDWACRESGLADAVKKAYPAGGIAEKLLSIAHFLVMTGETVNNIESWQYEHDLPYQEGMSEDMCYELFDILGLNEAGMQRLFANLAEIGEADGKGIIAFDSTTVSSYSDPDGDIKPFARAGLNKAGDGLDTFKLLTFYSIGSRLPISFELQPGNIADVSSLLNAVKRLKVFVMSSPALVVMDNGFFSQNNVCSCLRQSVKFTMRATLDDTWIFKHLAAPATAETPSVMEELQFMGNVCPFDSSTRGATRMAMTEFTWKRQKARGDKKAGDTERKSFRLYYHYYLNEAKATSLRTEFSAKLQNIKARIEAGEELSDADAKLVEKFLIVKKVRGGVKVSYNEKACLEAQRYFGMFVLISNEDKDAWSALKHYRQRTLIERSYAVIKSELDGERARVWTIASERGKEICRLIALGLHFYLQDALDRVAKTAQERAADESLTKTERKRYEQLSKWMKKMTLKKTLRWFDCVETVTVENQKGKNRWITESIKRDALFKELLFKGAPIE